MDARAWLAWASAASLLALVTRNPFIVLALLAVVLAVRQSTVVREPLVGRSLWTIALVVIAIGVLLNVVLVRAGDVALGEILGRRITANAIAYGAASGIAMLVLVMIGVTVAERVSMPDLVGMAPSRVTNVAAAGSVAWSFAPAATRAVHEIRDVHWVRGENTGAIRMLPGLVVPLLEQSLERAMSVAEALEARGFGAGHRKTRYRVQHMSRQDWFVCAASVGSLACLAGQWLSDGDALVFNPYPTLDWPVFPALAAMAVALLFAPCASGQSR